MRTLSKFQHSEKVKADPPFDAQAFVRFIEANVNNDKLDAIDFRQLVRNCLKPQTQTLFPYRLSLPLEKCKHCGTKLAREGEQWVNWTGGVLRQYCWIDQTEGSQLHEP
jgi:hypothetical protein